jgi:hypothetical protein
MKVYSSAMYGNGILCVTLGKKHRHVEEFFEATEADANGVVSRDFRSFAVKFVGGVAEVSDAMAAYLLEHETDIVSAAPVQVQQNPRQKEDANFGRPAYRKPIDVSRPLDRETRERLADHIVG